MVARLNETLWSMTDLAEMIDGSLPKPRFHNRYKKTDRLTRMGQWAIDLFLRNPVAWFLLALFLMAEYWNYEGRGA